MVVNTMEFFKPFEKVLILWVLIFTASSCNTFIAKPYPTPKPTTTNPLVLTLTPESTFTAIMTQTRESKPAATHTAPPTVFGTPLPDYKTIPIPADAVAGIDIGNRYQFTSKLAPIEVSNYYEQVLPQFGWEVRQVSILEGEVENATRICMALSQVSGPFQAVLCISKKTGEELTSVRIAVYTTN